MVYLPIDEDWCLKSKMVLINLLGYAFTLYLFMLSMHSLRRIQAAWDTTLWLPITREVISSCGLPRGTWSVKWPCLSQKWWWHFLLLYCYISSTKGQVLYVWFLLKMIFVVVSTSSVVLSQVRQFFVMRNVFCTINHGEMKWVNIVGYRFISFGLLSVDWYNV